jgi:uncharacterized membrane protein
MEPNQTSNVPVPPPAPTSSNNNIMAIISYLGILVIIPLGTNKDDQFVKFHSKQGLVLLITWVIGSILWSIPVLGWFTAPIINLGCFILMILGIVNASSGQMKELPIIGRFANNFNF